LDALLSMDETCTVCCRIVASDDGDLLFNPLRGEDWCGMVWFLSEAQGERGAFRARW
jgi:hypothetical protein